LAAKNAKHAKGSRRAPERAPARWRSRHRTSATGLEEISLGLAFLVFLVAENSSLCCTGIEASVDAEAR
jgi:hypothetical protein